MRFPEFECAWERKKLGEIATFTKGKGISKNDIDENGKIECIRYGELYTHYNEVITEIKSKTNIDKEQLIFSKTNDVIIPSSGETQIDIATASCILKSGVALGGDLNIIKTSTDGIFLSYYLNSRKKLEIANLAQGISVVHLYASQLALLEVALPEIQEQIKIANFLRLLDERIKTQNKIIEGVKSLKISLNKKIFTQELRLSEFNEQWQLVRLGDMGTFFSGGTPHTSMKEYYNGDIPFIKSGEINEASTEQCISKEGLKNSSTKMIEVGDLLYALYGATSGEVGISKIRGAINQAILCIRTNLNNVFLLNYLKYEKGNILKTFLQGGQGNLSAEIIKNLKVPYPSSEEQQKIATFFSIFDQKLESEIAILKLFTKQKQYLLQQMFI